MLRCVLLVVALCGWAVSYAGTNSPKACGDTWLGSPKLPGAPPLRRSYSCKVLNSSVHTPRACMLGRPCPDMPLVSFGGQQSVYTSGGADCAMRCDCTPGCRAFASSRCQDGSSEMGDCIRCFLYDRIGNITEKQRSLETSPRHSRLRLGSEATREPRGEPLRVCALQGSSGCSQPTLPPRSRTLILVLVMKYNTHNLADWMNYHRVLGVRHFVIISNECGEEEHRHLVATAASVPCMPRLSFINSFRCATVFQAASYREAVRLLLESGEDPDARVGFFDVDEFLVVRRGKADPTAVDALFRRGKADAPMWAFGVVPFGPSGHKKRPAGFVPANFLLAGVSHATGPAMSDGGSKPYSTYGSYPKSVCSLSSMAQAWAKGEKLFDSRIPNLALRWPHHCMWEEQSWGYPMEEAQLQHYVTRDEASWRSKCSNSNPTTPGKSRSTKSYCNESMMPAFFDKISEKVDLRLFEEFDPSMIQEDFLTRSPLPPATRDLLSEHCRASPNIWRGAAHVLCADFVSAPPPPPSTSLHAYACDCVALHLNLAPEKGTKCVRKKNDGSFCWTQCCRPDVDNPHKPPRAGRLGPRQELGLHKAREEMNLLVN